MIYRILSFRARKRVIGLSILFANSVFASNGHLYVELGMGTSMANIGKTIPQIVYDYDSITDAYPISGSHATTPVISVNSGYEFSGHGYIPAIAIGVGAYSSLWNHYYNFNGQVIETPEGDTSTTLYSYRYQVSNKRVMAEAQFSWLVGRLVPFINFGIGPSWNRLSSYSEIPTTNNGYLSLPPFRSNTNTCFSYQAGMGMSYVFNFLNYSKPHDWYERISLGYRFVSLGNISSGIRSADYPYYLNAGTLRSNEIYLSYTHLFGGF